MGRPRSGRQSCTIRKTTPKHRRHPAYIVDWFDARAKRHQPSFKTYREAQDHQAELFRKGPRRAEVRRCGHVREVGPGLSGASRAARGDARVETDDGEGILAHLRKATPAGLWGETRHSNHSRRGQPIPRASSTGRRHRNRESRAIIVLRLLHLGAWPRSRRGAPASRSRQTLEGEMEGTIHLF